MNENSRTKVLVNTMKTQEKGWLKKSWNACASTATERITRRAQYNKSNICELTNTENRSHPRPREISHAWNVTPDEVILSATIHRKQTDAAAEHHQQEQQAQERK